MQLTVARNQLTTAETWFGYKPKTRLLMVQDNRASTNIITTLINGLSNFDGTPSKFPDWRRTTRCVLSLNNMYIVKITERFTCPTAIYKQDFAKPGSGGRTGNAEDAGNPDGNHPNNKGT